MVCRIFLVVKKLSADRPQYDYIAPNGPNQNAGRTQHYQMQDFGKGRMRYVLMITA